MNRLTPFFLKTTSLIWYTSILLILAAGWATRNQKYLVAESGIGYWFGIIGGSLMLLLLIYPMRKRFRRWSAIGSVKAWFRLHMILGVVGPVLIVFHSGFNLGSFNSRVAFFCMVIVATSGLVGRMLYQRIHHGLYGSKIRHEELYANQPLPASWASQAGSNATSLASEFSEIEGLLTQPNTEGTRSVFFYMRMKSKVGRLARKINRIGLGKAERREVRKRLQALRSICTLGINEILFSYWHVLHMPLFILLVASGLIHVTVVHLY